MGYSNTLLALLMTSFLWMAEARASAAATNKAAHKALVIRSLETTAKTLQGHGLGSHTTSSSNDTTHPSSATLAGCPTSCGNLSIQYPFGIGPDDHCFRDPDFRLFCNSTARGPKLLLHDGTTEVSSSIDDFVYHQFEANLFQVIHIRPGVDVYDMSFKAPGNSFTILEMLVIIVVGCDLDVLLKDQHTDPKFICAVNCPNRTIAEMVYAQDPDGPGYCYVFADVPVLALEFQFVLHKRGRRTEKVSSMSILWDRINITVRTPMEWSIVDHTRCPSNNEDRRNSACVSEHSGCNKELMFLDHGYNCQCNDGYQGNPYIHGGCMNDEGYNPKPVKENCSHQCGNITVPFPFGLEEGCSARRFFQLNCSDQANSVLQYNDRLHVTYINVSEGLVSMKFNLSWESECGTGYADIF